MKDEKKVKEQLSEIFGEELEIVSESKTPTNVVKPSTKKPR